MPRTSYSISPYLSTYLDLFRWVAAFAVVLSHAKHVFLVDRWGQLEDGHQHIIMKAFFAIGGLGHQGVIIFFVISGFLVGGTLLQKWIHGSRLELTDYSMKRVSRLMLVLIPALGFTLLFDWIGYSLLGVNNLYYAYQDFAEAKAIPTLIGNLFFLQEIFVPPYGSNISLWSLSYEFWYYFLFPAVLMVLRPQSTVNARITSLLVVCSISYLLLPNILVYFGVWLLGAAIKIYTPKTLPWSVKFYFIQFVLALFLTRLFVRSELKYTWPGVMWDYVVAFSFGLLLLKLKTIPDGRPLPFAKWHSFLAQSSYSLYLFHLPFLCLLVGLLLKGGIINSTDSQPTRSLIALMFLSIVPVYLFSFGAYYCFERHTKTIQERILAAISPKN